MELPLPALPGSKLIGFLAALGTLRTLSIVPDTGSARMRWAAAGASYIPILELDASTDADVLVTRLHAQLRNLADHFVVCAAKDLKIPREVFRELAVDAAEGFLNHSDPDAAGIVASFGCDAIANEDGLVEDTAFRTMSGAGHQHFLEFVRLLARETTAEQLREALFGPWRYRDPSPTMRWDSEDDRRYALRWDEPSKDPVRTVRGANLLAVAALPLFPVVPVSSRVVATAGFSGRGSGGIFITWPIWTGWLDIESTRSLLGRVELQAGSERSLGNLARCGVAAVYRSQRITLGKFRNFTPASPV